MNGRSSVGFESETVRHQLSQLIGVEARVQRREFNTIDFLAKKEQIHLFAVEGTVQGGHFVQQTAHAPNI